MPPKPTEARAPPKINVMVPPLPTPELQQNPDKGGNGLRAAMALQGVKPKTPFEQSAAATDKPAEKDAQPKKLGGLFDTNGMQPAGGGLFTTKPKEDAVPSSLFTDAPKEKSSQESTSLFGA